MNSACLPARQARQLKIDPLDAELLLAHVLRKPREWVLAHPKTKITKTQDTRYKQLATRRANGEPIAYLTGHKEFFGLDFEVNKDVLIPRPDTETLVTSALEHLSTSAHRPITLIDVGTGSGCIPIAIAKYIRKSGLSGNLDSIIAIDISAKALAVARRNAKKHGVKIKFIQGDMLAPVIARRPLPTKQSGRQSSIIITANLPYLTNKQFKSSPSIQHEPRLALVANKNGLALYKKLLKQIQSVMCYVSHVTCFMEIDPSQSTPITRLIKSILPTAKVEIIKDLAGLDRVVKIMI